MARGVISTVLGGLAGGFEGLAARQQRQRAEEEQRRREELEDTRWREAQRINLQTQGFRPVASALDQASRTSQAGEGLESAGNLMLPGGGVVRMSPIGSALRAAGEQQRSSIDRGFQVGLGDETYFLPYEMTPQGIREAEVERADRIRAEDISRDDRLIREQREYDQLVAQNDQFFQREMAEFTRQTGLELARLSQDNQKELLGLRHEFDIGLHTTPEQRLAALQNSFVGMLPRFIDETGAFNHEAAHGVATYLGSLAEITGPEFLNMAVNEFERRLAQEEESLPSSGLVDRSGLERARQFELAAEQEAMRLEELRSYLEELQAELARTTNARARTQLQRDINRVRGDIVGLSGERTLPTLRR